METINFRDFMKGHKNPPKEIKLNSIVFNPLWLIDPNMLICGAVVLGVVGIEKTLVLFGYEEIAEGISVFFQVAFPFIAFGAVVVFLVTNPITSWL